MDIFGIKKLSSAIGMLMPFQGLALYINHYITAEFLKENCSIFVYMSGLMITISGVMCFLIPRFKSYKALAINDLVVQSNSLTQIN